MLPQSKTMSEPVDDQTKHSILLITKPWNTETKTKKLKLRQTKLQKQTHTETEAHKQK